MQFDAVDYIVKPVNPAALRLRLRNLVQLKRLQDQLGDIATHDPLTGLSNRRRFDGFLADEWRRGQRSRSPLALLRLNVDRLRHFNEQYNTLNGDAALRRIAEVLGTHQRRPGDMAARLEGDDFALALAATDAVGALSVAESVRRRVELLAILHADSTAGVLTVSCGVAVVRGDSPLAELAAQADEQLAKAKQTGRNRVAIQPIR
jgi:diguanylate cyclase (GGDEF)-like protein